MSRMILLTSSCPPQTLTRPRSVWTHAWLPQRPSGCLARRSLACSAASAHPPPVQHDEAGTDKQPSPWAGSCPSLHQAVQHGLAAAAAWAMAAAPALASSSMTGLDRIDPQGPSLLDFLALTICFYWMFAFISTMVQRSQNRRRGGQSVDDIMSQSSHAHIRSYIDLSEKSKENPDWQDVRNKSFANNATFSVQIAIKESLPRIKMVLDEASHPEHTAQLHSHNHSHSPEVDPVVQLAHDVLKQTTGDANGHISDADVHQLEMRMAEAVAEQAAWEQINMLTKVAHAAMNGDVGPGASPSAGGGPRHATAGGAPGGSSKNKK